MRLTPAQRNFFFEAIPTQYGSEVFLVFEDDGGGWHNDPTVENWVTWRLVSDGIRYLYNVRSTISETWNSATSGIDEELGQIERGSVDIYVCSTDKAKVQAAVSILAGLIERTRMGLSLDVEGLTTGPDESKTHVIGSYNDLRLKRRVYRTVLEVPIIYKFSEIVSPPLIKQIDVEPWMGYPLAEMETLTVRAPLLLGADILILDSVSSTLSVSIILSE